MREIMMWNTHAALQEVFGDDAMPETLFYEWCKAFEEEKEECGETMHKWDMPCNFCKVDRTSDEGWLPIFSESNPRLFGQV